MCGRFAYNKEQITPWAKDVLGVVLDVETNLNASPSQSIAALDSSLSYLPLQWGIKPQWSKKLLINAQAETVATKPTFKHAFANNRCLIPCSGWFEWRDEGGSRKQKYYFQAANDEPLLMAAIAFNDSQVVTLTTEPNNECREIHKRMPVLISPSECERWYNEANPSDLLIPVNDGSIIITKA